MAQQNRSNERTFKAGADLSALQYTFVKLDSTQNQVVGASAGTDNIIGVLMNAPKQNQEARVALVGSGSTVKITASAAISLGATVSATTAGQAVTDTTSGHRICGIALEAAAAQNDIIEILLTNYKY